MHTMLCSALENRDYGRGDPLRWPRDTLYQLKLALISPTGCGRSVGIVRLWTKTTEFSFLVLVLSKNMNTVQIRMDIYTMTLSKHNPKL
jgi:hypothetical protein